MPSIDRINISTHAVDITRGLDMLARGYRPGPPERMDGMSVGIVEVHGDAPHAGEMHPDGDELLYVFSGQLRVHGESAPESPFLLGPGDACIVRRGEWHRIEMVAPALLLHVTPGPRGEHRPLPTDRR